MKMPRKMYLVKEAGRWIDFVTKQSTNKNYENFFSDHADSSDLCYFVPPIFNLPAFTSVLTPVLTDLCTDSCTDMY